MKYGINKIKKILIANRGGIVSRINFTCKSLGIQTVSIFCPQDASSPYIYKTDSAYQINKNGYLAYLDQNEIINIALKSGANAIHPGYGFLSESHTFAQKVVDAGLIWIGPNPETIKLMGDKNEARRCADLAGVPTVPGTKLDANTNPTQALELAYQIGFPLILKDPLGGGGKAARRVDRPEDFEYALKQTRSEAQKLTGTNTILMERYLVNPRHIEIQIAGDGQNFVHLFERDCSLQRRYQKIVEEAPCCFVGKQTLEKMYQAAIQLAKTVKYKNIGTIEFMVTPDEEFFFLEMNTRLQVEHSVTEMTTGLDLVATQIFIADSDKLPFKQEKISQRGHAIECRIYSEDFENNFTPSTGTIKCLQLPHGQNIRLDHDLEAGKEVTPYFDPMQAQLTIYGQSRKIAIDYMYEALKNFGIHGITSNIEFLAKIMKSDKFKEGHIHTQFLTPENIQNINSAAQTEYSTEFLSNEELATISATIIQKLHKQRKQLCKSTNSWKKQQWT